MSVVDAGVRVLRLLFELLMLVLRLLPPMPVYAERVVTAMAPECC